ncbi:MAG: hypothetical protein ABL898_19290 [Hyphomicrobiaceae bacterium]
MIRIVLENVLLFFIPTALYLAYTFFATEIPSDGPTDGPARPKTFMGALENAPIIWLIVSGMAMVGITMAIFGARQESSIDRPYEPAIYKDGKIVQPSKK